MVQRAYNPETGETVILNEQTGTWVPDAGTTETLLVGAGAGLTRYGRGLLNVLNIGDVDARRERQRIDDRFLSGLREANPVASAIGEALPALATAPLSAGTSAARFALAAGLGAAEGGLTGAATDRGAGMGALLGAGGGFVGEVGGRMAGRVVNAIARRGAALRTVEDIPFFDRRGLQMLPSEQLADEGVEAIQRLEQGAQASIIPPRIFRQIPEERRAYLSNVAADAIGITRNVDELTPEILGEASESLANQFQQFTRDAIQGAEGAVMEIGDELAERIANTGQIRKAIRRGSRRWAGLTRDGQKFLTPDELVVARRALAQDAANEAGSATPAYELAEEIFDDVEELDSLLTGIMGEDALQEYANLRERYRNLQILQKRGVIGNDNTVSPLGLRNALRADTGYGRTFREGNTDGLLPETQELLESARVLAKPEFQPPRTSMTAERTAAREAARDVGLAVAAGDPVAAVGLGSQLIAPLLLNAVDSAEGANIAGGLLMESLPIFGQAGRELGILGAENLQ